MNDSNIKRSERKKTINSEKMDELIAQFQAHTEKFCLDNDMTCHAIICLVGVDEDNFYQRRYLRVVPHPTQLMIIQLAANVVDELLFQIVEGSFKFDQEKKEDKPLTIMLGFEDPGKVN